MITQPTLPQLPPALSHIPARSPEWKSHDNLGHAKNAVAQKIRTYSYRDRDPLGASCDMHIFILEDGRYVPHWVIPKGMPDEELPWRKKKRSA